jgi:hypothetical protein
VKLVAADIEASVGAAAGSVAAVLQVTLKRVPTASFCWTMISLLAGTAVVLMTQVPVEAVVEHENDPDIAEPHATRDGLAPDPTAAQLVAEAILVKVWTPVKVSAAARAATQPLSVETCSQSTQPAVELSHRASAPEARPEGVVPSAPQNTIPVPRVIAGAVLIFREPESCRPPASVQVITVAVVMPSSHNEFVREVALAALGMNPVVRPDMVLPTAVQLKAPVAVVNWRKLLAELQVGKAKRVGITGIRVFVLSVYAKAK